MRWWFNEECIKIKQSFEENRIRLCVDEIVLADGDRHSLEDW